MSAARTYRALLALIGLSVVSEARGWGDDPIIIALFSDARRSEVVAEFIGKGSPFDGGFWARRVDGETPSLRLKTLAADDARAMGTTMARAMEFGLLPCADFGGLEKLRLTENRRRRQALAQGGILYGAVLRGPLEWLRYQADRVAIAEKRSANPPAERHSPVKANFPRINEPESP